MERDYMTRDECLRLHEELDTTRELGIAESRNDRRVLHTEVERLASATNGKVTEIHTRIDSLTKWAIGTIVVLIIAAGTILLQGQARVGALNAATDELHKVQVTLTDLNEKVATQNWRLSELSDAFIDHKEETEKKK